ncbi:MAG: NAD(P)H-dependent oxidoreductase subunit E [Lachnospiraceae bacterium]|uniref:NADH-quinone oxidoreductase subunit NuoE family protein n=1 Tax=Parablautia sp. Marseille-Q6255 TaxID=3039593 RepID=UPI0024BD4521|nr:NAD(P)H-dependent oxidoreductase subunit E [Parablautia sp. Marseille-Q6255]
MNPSTICDPSGAAAAELKEIFAYYAGQRDKKDQDVIVQMLKELQEVNGFLTPELKEQAAQTAEVPLSLISLLIRTYPSLKEAAYTHVITVCSGERCAKKNGRQIAEIVRRELRIGKNNLSADGTCLLKTQNCLKQCRTSANFIIDDVLYSNIKPEQVPDILKQALSAQK